MKTMLMLVGLVIVIFLIGSFIAQRKVTALRRRGIYPENGKETGDDVARLLRAGEELMAIRCYRTIHKVGLKQAKEAVESLKKELV